MKSEDRHNANLVSRALLAAPFVIAPLLLGGVFHHLLWSRVIMGIVTILLATVILLHGWQRHSLHLTPVVFLPLLLAVISLMQLVPLPIKLFSPFSSTRYTLFHSHAFATHPISAAIPQTEYSVIRLLFLALFAFSLGLFIRNKQHRVRFILKTMVFITTGFIIFSLVLRILGTTRWLDADIAKNAFLFAFPIVNPNNVAGWLGVSGLSALALLNEKKTRKSLYVTIFFLHVIAVCATFSRGGILSFTLAVGLYVFLGGTEWDTKKYMIPALVFLALAVFYAGHPIADTALFSGNGIEQKIGPFLTALRLASLFPLFGIGSGAFETTFSYMQINPENRFIYPENEPTQLMTEFGIPAALLFVGFLLFILLKNRSKKNIPYYTILLFIILQNSADFSIHLFAVQFMVISILVIISKDIVIADAYKQQGIMVISLLVAIIVVIYSGTTTHKEFDEELTTESYNSLVYNYPLSYRPPLNTALALLKNRKTAPSAGAFLSQATLLAPHYYYPVFLTGVYFLRIGVGQEAAMAFSRSVTMAPRETVIPLIRKIEATITAFSVRSLLLPFLQHVPPSMNDTVYSALSGKIRAGDSLFLKPLKNRFPVLYAKALFREQKYDELIEVVEENSNLPSREKRFQLLSLRASVQLASGQKNEALQTLRRLMHIKPHFYTTLRYASLARKIDGFQTTEELHNIQSTLRTQAGTDRKKNAALYRWLAEVAWHNRRYKESLDDTRKSLTLQDNNNIRLLLIRRLIDSGIYQEAQKEINILKARAPHWKEKYLSVLEEKIREKQKTF